MSLWLHIQETNYINIEVYSKFTNDRKTQSRHAKFLGDFFIAKSFHFSLLLRISIIGHCQKIYFFVSGLWFYNEIILWCRVMLQRSNIVALCNRKKVHNCSVLVEVHTHFSVCRTWNWIKHNGFLFFIILKSNDIRVSNFLNHCSTLCDSFKSFPGRRNHIRKDSVYGEFM